MMRDKDNKCPDGGKCHHKCKEECFRVKFCSPLNGVFENDKWPIKIND